jgi:hypothetical protein
MKHVKELLKKYIEADNQIPEERDAFVTYMELIAELQEAIEQDEKENGWIPVSERLPEDGTYITTLDGELVGQEEPFTGMCGIENEKWDDEDCVIAWMPLPEPYKED